MTDPEKQIKFQSGATIDLVGTDKPETYCGIEPIVTGPLDPWWKRACVPHDKAMQAYIDGHPTEGPYQTFGKFTKNIGVGMLQGAYMLLTGIPYLLIGGVLGLFRNQQLANRLHPKEDDDVLGDDT